MAGAKRLRQSTRTNVVAGLGLLAAILIAGAALALLREYAGYAQRCAPHITDTRGMFLEGLWLRTLWRGSTVLAPVEAVPLGTAVLDARGGPRRHFWLIHDSRGFTAFRATAAYSLGRDQDLNLLAQWTGSDWQPLLVGGGQFQREYFFGHVFGGAYDRGVRLVFGPAHRDLDLFPATQAGQSVIVDTATIVYGACRTEACNCFP